MAESLISFDSKIVTVILSGSGVTESANEESPITKEYFKYCPDLEILRSAHSLARSPLRMTV